MTAKTVLGGIAVVLCGILAGCKDDTPDTPILSMTDVSGSEDDTVAIQIRLSAISKDTVTADFFTTNITTQENDYRLRKSTVKIAPGNLRDSIQVVMFKDVLTENTESFKVSLIRLVNARFEGHEAIVTIHD